MIESETLRNLDLRAIVEHFRKDSVERPTDANLYSALLESFQDLNLQELKPLSQYMIAGFRKSLKDAYTEGHFNRLLKLGVQEETLIPILLFFSLFPSVDLTLRNFLGEPRERKRKAKALRDAARVMDEIAALTPAGADEIAGNGTNAHLLSTPKLTADSLHFYANFLFIYEQLRQALDVNSGEEVAKYSFAASVKLITGKYHDREVSAIMGVILGKRDYDETAHRVWRTRTVRRLNPTCSFFPTLIHAFNSAVAKQFDGEANQESTDL